MVESGDWVVPRVQDRARLNKPPLIYWLQSASVMVLGDAPGQYRNGNIWVFRLPSVLCAIASVLLTWRLGLRLMDPRAAALGAGLLAVCPMVAWDAHQARADQLLLLTVVASQHALFVCWRHTQGGRKDRQAPLIWCVYLWASVGLGVLAKGPITPMIVSLTLGALCLQSRRMPRHRGTEAAPLVDSSEPGAQATGLDAFKLFFALRPLLGLGIVLAVVAPWVVTVALRIGWAEYLGTIYEETVGRSAAAREGHWGPPGYHLVLLCVLFWPGVMFTGLALRRAWKRQRRPGELFLLAWIVPAWIAFELVATKLPHYTMPVYPAIALLSGRAVLAAASGTLIGIHEWGTRIGLAIWALVGVGIMVAGLALLSLLSRFDDVNDAAMVTSLWYLPIGFVLVMVLRSMLAGEWLQAQLRSMVAVVMMLVLLFTTLAPAANRMSTRVVQAINDIDPKGERPITAVGYQEDSLIFLTRGRVRRAAAVDLRALLSNPGEAVLVLPDIDMPGEAPSRHQGIRGLNYSRGRVESVQIFWWELQQ